MNMAILCVAWFVSVIVGVGEQFVCGSRMEDVTGKYRLERFSGGQGTRGLVHLGPSAGSSREGLTMWTTRDLRLEVIYMFSMK